MFNLVPVNDVRKTEDSFLSFIERDRKDIFDGIENGRELTDEIVEKLNKAIEDFKATIS